MKEVKNRITIAVILLGTVALWSCTNRSIHNEKNTAVHSVDTTTVVLTDENTIKDTIYYFDKVSKFKSQDGILFTSDKYSLVFSEFGNAFNVKTGVNNIGKINFGRDFEGPGFSVWLYQAAENAQNIDIIIIEAMADIGTAWYYITVLNNNRVSHSFYIDEPRANSEETLVSDFINIEYINPKFIFKFKKDLIAKYSSIPDDMEEYESFYIRVYNNQIDTL